MFEKNVSAKFGCCAYMLKMCMLFPRIKPKFSQVCYLMCIIWGIKHGMNMVCDIATSANQVDLAQL